MIGGEYVGNGYRIGELAEIAHVSKRTIDYYTNLGLLTAHRSDSNYRYYDKNAVEILHFIEQCKKMHMPLSDIKQLLARKHTAIDTSHSVATHVDEVTRHIQELEQELAHLKPLLDELTNEQRETIMKYVSGRATNLMQTLLLFLG
nr:MerR family transcriptional regulator [Ectobacillus antri]